MGNRLFLEIIAKRKIAEHFKKRMMPRCITDIIQVIMFAARTDAFLTADAARGM